MKIELSEERIALLLAGLDTLADAIDKENRVRTDPDLTEINNDTLREIDELYEYIADYKEEGR